MNLKTKLAVAGVAALAAAGTGAALAAVGGSGSSLRATPGVRGAAAAWGERAPGPGFRLGVGLQAAADYLGVSLATLRSDLQSGKTLAQVADGTSGKSAQGLVDSLVAKAKASLDKAVAAGKLKQAQEDAIVSNLQQRVTAMVNATHPASPRPFGGRGFGGRGFSHGFGFGGGRRGWAPPSGSTTA